MMADGDDAVTTIPEMLQYRANAKEDRDRKSFRFHDRHGFVDHLTPSDIYSMAGKFAHLLRGWGFKKGEVIANGLPNSPERVVTDFGIIMAGCVLVNCQTIETDGSDFWHTARISHCTGVIFSARPDNAPNKIFSNYLSLNQTASPPNKTAILADIVHDVNIPKAPTIRKVIVCDRKSSIAKLEEQQQSHRPQRKLHENEQEQRRKQADEKSVNHFPTNESFLEALKRLRDDTECYQSKCEPSDLVVLLCTSGPTGFNKLVPRTHQDILDAGRSIGKQGRDLLQLNDRPLGWLGGFPSDFIANGSCRVLQDAFNSQTIKTPKQIWDLVSTTQCQGVSTMSNDVIRLIDEYERNPPEHKVMFIATGGEPIRQDLYKAVGLLCQFVVVSYGCSEGGMFTVGIINDPNCQFGDFFSGTVYRNDIHIKVVGEDGNALDPGEDGEIYVKCDQIIKDYYNVEASSSNPQPRLLTDDGWFRTGDRGKILSDGRLYCYGRQGDVTSINGVIIYLSWLETILNKCPRVQNSSVIAIDDTDNKDGGVLFCGFVEPKPDSNLTEVEVKEFFAEQIVDTEYKDKLSLAHVFAVDTIPAIPTGKVNKRALKDIAIERLK